VKPIIVYTDGSADLDGYGGAAAVLFHGEREKKVSEGFRPGTLGVMWLPPGRYAKVTNQQMEIMSCILALSPKTIKKRDRRWKVIIRSDSKYVVNCFNEGWIENWRRKNWINKGEERPNRALWETLEALVANFDVEFEWLRGHNGDPGNEAADRLAEWARLQARVEGMNEGDTLNDWTTGKDIPRRPSQHRRRLGRAPGRRVVRRAR
jgi:ribonuclease HI